MRVRDIMSRPVFTTVESDTIEKAAALLSGRKVTAAPVCDRNGDLVGMVSEGDLLWHRVPADPAAHHATAKPAHEPARPHTVADVMSRDPVTTWPDADVAEVAETMLSMDVRSVPVVEDGTLVGIVSRRDILRTVIRTDDVIAAEVQHRLEEYAGSGDRWAVTVVEGVVTVTGPFDDDAERAVVTVMVRTVPGVVAAHPAG